MERQEQGTDRGKKIELLAPAGNREAFYGAVHAGADAVYMGGERFGARAYADNFSREDLIECIRYGHLYGCKSYLTVNTLMKERELAELVEELEPLYQAGLDGVIVQDVGALRVIRQYFHGLELHASTQMTVTGPRGAALLSELGVSRVVPARELSLAELVELREDSGLEVEAFVHGSMCYCYSGVCLFSSILGGRSGNRGRCAQPCRLAYETESPGGAVHRKEYYPLSLKDLCALEHLPELVKGGIDSLKIEGRMKRPEYAAGVTAIYRKYLDRCLAHPQRRFQVEKQDMEALSRLYIRSQRQDGYYFRHNGREMVTLDSPSYSGGDEVYLSKLRQRYIDQKKRLGIWMRAIFVCGEPARLEMGMGGCQVQVVGNLVEPAQNRPVTEEDLRKQLQKLGETCFVPERLEIHTDGKGFYSLKEVNILRREAVRSLEDRIITDHGLPVSRMEDRPLSRTGDWMAQQEGETAAEKPPAGSIRVHISTESQLLYMAEAFGTGSSNGSAWQDSPKIDRLYVESRLLLADHASAGEGRRETEKPDKEKTRRALERLREAGIALWAALPYVLRSRDRQIMEQSLELYNRGRIQGFLVRNLEEYGWLRQEEGICLQLDHTVYVWNSQAAAFWRERGCGLTCPLELNGREWDELLKTLRTQMGEAGRPADYGLPEKLVYGRIPMMVTANCIARTAGKCLKDQGCQRSEGALTDRYRTRFPVEICCDVCMNVIYNSVPLSLHKELARCHDIYPRLSFTTENGRETGQILEFFAGCAAGKTGSPPYGDYTTGHERRGVL